MNKFLKPALSYFGGKSKIAFEIIKKAYEICPNIQTFIDAFAGGGVVGLAAKLNNIQVISNDHSYYSFCYNKAIIENTTVKLDIYDVLKIYNSQLYEDFTLKKNIPEEIIKIESKISKYIPIPIHRNFLLIASYLNNINKIFNNEYKSYMINALIIKLFIRLLPFSNPTDDFFTDIISDHYNPKHGIKAIKTILQPTMNIIQKIIEELNYAVFDNKQTNQVYNMDVYEFLSFIQDKINTEKTVIYLDPPYKDATKTYEDMYNILNELLFKEKSKTSIFNKLNAKEKILSLLTYKFKYYIISYAGEYVNQIINEILKHNLSCEIVKIPYKWTMSTITSKKHKQIEEYLLIIRK